ncbi:GyrI-like domain-containing protein [Methanococcoides orientis]|uniref:GyrI-like domain-containing protein n=1 Tax=Methanococcoides orientis TaxID=2822137 RepID=UPI001E653D8F|nr:GyrI-like domain-containing protein [Methanococcoides orientis]UGV39911.1 GyrI-like domain-containing protein [Methanococcoides orientis]
MSDIHIVEVGPQLVVGMRKTGKYELIAVMLPELFQYTFDKGIEITGGPTFICHEAGEEAAMKAEREGNADVEVAIPVAKKAEETDTIKFYELPGGKMAKTIHKGPYEDSTETYRQFFAWIEEKGLTITGPTREIYLNDPVEVSPEEILTEIYAPVD